MPIGTQLLQHTVYRYRGPGLVDDIDSVWIITWHRSLSRIVMIPSGIYNPVWVTYYRAWVTFSYSNDTFGYIQYLLVQTFFSCIRF